MTNIKQHIEDMKRFGMKPKRNKNRHTGAGLTLRELQMLENTVKRFRKLKLKPGMSYENSESLEKIIFSVNDLIMKNLD
jgi:hypothetical protein